MITNQRIEKLLEPASVTAISRKHFLAVLPILKLSKSLQPNSGPLALSCITLTMIGQEQTCFHTLIGASDRYMLA